MKIPPNFGSDIGKHKNRCTNGKDTGWYRPIGTDGVQYRKPQKQCVKMDSHFTFRFQCDKMVIERGDFSPQSVYLSAFISSDIDMIKAAVAATALIIRLMMRSFFFHFITGTSPFLFDDIIIPRIYV